MPDTIQTIERASCTGCAACRNACPVNAIAMQEDADGFLYPKVDESKCVHCGACLRACPVHQPDFSND